MNIFEKLDNKEKIYDYIKTYARPSSDSYNKISEFASLDYLLRFWTEKKEDFYHMFNDNFILEKDVTVNKLQSDLVNDFKRAWNENNSPFDEFQHQMDHFINCDIDEYELDGMSKWELSRTIDCLFNLNCLALNKFEYSTRSFTYKGKKVTIQYGCKPVKMLGKIATVFGLNLDKFEQFRLKQSLITNQRTTKGTLCLSIHPLDYMTMSDNDSGWQSCMSWRNLGCYCRGTVEMMNSPYVIIGYLKSSDSMNLETGWGKKVPWNNKKWRELYVITDNGEVITNIKGYPYENDELTQLCLKWIGELASKYYGTTYTEPQKYNYDDNVIINNKRFDLTMETYTMYNDFGRCTHTLIASNNFLDSIPENECRRIYTEYSGPEICMCCGGQADFDCEGDLICLDCYEDNRIECYCCGELCSEDEIYYLDDEPYCESCYDEYASYDELSQESHHIDNMEKVYVVPSEITDFRNVDLSLFPSFNIYYQYLLKITDKTPCWQINRLNNGKLLRTDSNGEFIKRMKRVSWGCTYYYITPENFDLNTYTLFHEDNYDYSCYDDNEEIVSKVYETYFNIKLRG